MLKNWHLVWRHARRTGLAASAASALLLAASANAQTNASGGHDTDQPIEINADALEVQQEQKLAVFRGNVDAKQGQLRLSADEIKVWYRDRDTGGGSDIQGAIIRIVAAGNVLISTPRETARGGRGEYDVVLKQITLTGDVVLTRGANVIRGERLVLDLENGRSEIKGSATQRVKGLFSPPKKKDRE